MDPDETGSLKYIYRFNKKLAGAESNVAIGLSRLGFKTGWISRLGDDPHGEYIRSFIMGKGRYFPSKDYSRCSYRSILQGNTRIGRNQSLLL